MEAIHQILFSKIEIPAYYKQIRLLVIKHCPFFFNNNKKRYW